MKEYKITVKPYINYSEKPYGITLVNADILEGTIAAGHPLYY
jgi:hypothetical protein